MKKTLKRTLSLVLAIVMLVSTMSMVAFADSSNGLPDYKTYTVLGDSNAVGFGLDAYFENADSWLGITDPAEQRQHAKEWDLIPGSYPQLLAQELGLPAGCRTDENAHPGVNACAHSCWSTREFLFMVNPNKYPDYDHSFLKALGYVDRDETIAHRPFMQQSIKDADLITVNFGSNDIYTTALNKVWALYDDEFEAIQDAAALITDDPSQFFNALIQIADNLGFLKTIISDFKGILDENVENFKANFPHVIEEIRALNNHADIVVVGVFCPISFDLRINHEIALDFKSSSDKRISEINGWLANECEYCDDYIFADVSHPETFGFGALDWNLLLKLDPNVSYSALTMVHPTDLGQVYMKNQIVSAIKAYYADQLKLTGRYSTYIKRNTLNWNELDGAQKYVIYRSTSEDGKYYKIGTSTSDIYYDYLTLFGITYYYKVVAVMDKYGDVTSPFSNVVSLKAR